MSTAPFVTLHALRRIGDRVLGLTDLPKDDAEAVAAMRDRYRLDVEGIAALVRRVVARGVSAGAPSVKVPGFRFVLEGGTVITVLATKRPKRRRRVVDHSEPRYVAGSLRWDTAHGFRPYEGLRRRAAEAAAEAASDGGGDGPASRQAQGA